MIMNGRPDWGWTNYVINEQRKKSLEKPERQKAGPGVEFKLKLNLEHSQSAVTLCVTVKHQQIYNSRSV